MSESRLSTSLITYGESLANWIECKTDMFCLASDTKAAEDVFHVAADELAEAWRAEFKDVAMQLVAAIQPKAV